MTGFHVQARRLVRLAVASAGGWASLATAFSAPPTAPAGPEHAERFVIGQPGGGPKSHVAFPDAGHDMVKVSALVQVDKAPAKGLNFFAVQVNFPNHTWAHGGLQGSPAHPSMNWGGLVSRGGGAADYQREDPAADLLLMQNGPDSQRSADYGWQVGKTYRISIERGRQIVFPAGTYVFIGHGPGQPVKQARQMWEWVLTLSPLDGHGPQQRSVLYDAADHVASFYIWNECGYGSCGQGQQAAWRDPTYSLSSAPGQTMRPQQIRWF